MCVSVYSILMCYCFRLFVFSICTFHIILLIFLFQEYISELSALRNLTTHAHLTNDLTNRSGERL